MGVRVEGGGQSTEAMPSAADGIFVSHYDSFVLYPLRPEGAGYLPLAVFAG